MLETSRHVAKLLWEFENAGRHLDWTGFSRLGLTLPLTDLRDKMRPLEVVRSRRGARVDESTCLESMRLGNGTVGSNPTLSANTELARSPARAWLLTSEKAYAYYRGRALCNRTL